jgi:hypothetical protein
MDHVLRGELSRGGDECSTDGDRSGLHRGLLDHVATLPAQRPTNATTHDAERVGRIDDGVDRQIPDLRLGYVNLHGPRT